MIKSRAEDKIQTIDNKIKNLIALRNNYFSMIIVISTGIAGLFLLKDTAVWTFIGLLFAGLYFEVTFILKFEYVSNKIDKLLEEDNG